MARQETADDLVCPAERSRKAGGRPQHVPPPRVLDEWRYGDLASRNTDDMRDSASLTIADRRDDPRL